MAPVRRAGHATTASGASLTWSAAEGRRGMRWREAITDKGILVRSLLLEVSPAGRPTRLEITTLAGMLTLHPEADESALHGNVVTADGVRHLAFGWSPAHALFVVESPACVAAVLGALASSVAVGGAVEVDGVRIDDPLEPQEAQLLVTRRAGDTWHLRPLDTAEGTVIRTDPDGRQVLAGAVDWPLEIRALLGDRARPAD